MNVKLLFNSISISNYYIYLSTKYAKLYTIKFKEPYMNEIIKAMKERRSIRKFKSEMPAKADLEQIVEAGLYAASGMGRNRPLRCRLH